MTLAELIEARLKDVTTTQREAQKVTRTAEDLALPAQILDARIARLDTRIKGLQTQRDEVVRRLDAAIAEQTELRDRLAKEARAWAERQPTPSQNPRPTKAGPTGAGAAAKSPSKTGGASRGAAGPAKKK